MEKLKTKGGLEFMNDERWIQERLFFSGNQYYESINTEIENAQSSIEVESYIFGYDKIGQILINNLIRASKRGVLVRILVDGFGSAFSIPILQQELIKSSVQFKVFHPLFGIWYIPIFRTLNRRNHRKVWIFDKAVAFAGSFNVSDVHTSLSGQSWRDSGIRVKGKQVQLLNQSFEKLWQRKLLTGDKMKGCSIVRLNDGINKRRAARRELHLRIRGAKKYLFFGNAYFAPHLGLILELCRCALRGVEVHILVPHRSDIFFMPWITSTFYFALLQSGVKVYEYLPSIYHAKNYVIDDWMQIGSTNLNSRSLLYDLEIDFKITHPKNRQILMAEIKKDLKNSLVITSDFFDKISLLRKFMTCLFLLFKRWI